MNGITVTIATMAAAFFSIPTISVSFSSTCEALSRLYLRLPKQGPGCNSADDGADEMELVLESPRYKHRAMTR